MLNFKNEYFTLEKGRLKYPTQFKDKSFLVVYGSKEGGVTGTELTAHIYKIPENYYEINAGQLDFSNYPNGIENDFLTIRVTNLDSLFSLPLNFTDWKDISPENLTTTFEKIGVSILDIQKRLSEVAIYIDSGKPDQINLPKLPVGCTWYKDQDENIVALPISDLYEKFQQMIDKLHKDIKDLLDIDYGEFNQGLRDKTDLLLKELSDLNLRLEASIKNLTIKKNEELITTGNEKKQEIIDETNNQLNILAGVGLALKPKQVSDIEFLKRVNAKLNEVYEVLGYYKFNDGATHKRVISDNDDGSGVQLVNGLWANIVHNGEVNVSWFGAKGDGVTDDTLAIQKAIDLANVINFQEKTYLIVVQEAEGIKKHSLLLKSDRIINFNFCTLKLKNPNNYINNSLLELKDVNNVRIYNGKLIGDRATNTNIGEHGHGIFILNSQNIEISGMIITEMFGDGIDTDTYWESEIFSENIKISNCVIKNCRRNGITFSAAKKCLIEKCHISNIYGTAPQSCIDIETNQQHRPAENITVIDNILLNDKYIGFVNGSTTKNLIFSGNYSDCNTVFNDVENLIISNNIFENYIKENNTSINLRSVDNVLFSKNSLINFAVSFEHTKNRRNNNDIKIENNIFDSTFNKRYISSTGTNFGNTKNIIIENNIFNSIKDIVFFIYSKIESISINNNKFFIEENTAQTRSLLIRSKSLKFCKNQINVKQGFDFSRINYLLNFNSDFSVIKNNVIDIEDNPNNTPIFAIAKMTTEETDSYANISFNEIDCKFEFILIQAFSISPKFSVSYNDFRNCKTLITGGIIDYNVGNRLKENIATQVEQLNSLYHLEKMKQENVYDDYIAYNDEKFAYDKQQEKLEEQKQLAYEQALKENPNLSYEEFIAIQPMTLNLVEEPQPSEALKKFMEKYL